VGSVTGVKIGVFGAAGRMGGEVCRAVVADPDLELAAAVDPRLPDAPLEVSREGLAVGARPDAMAGVDVAIDFTVASSARANARWCADHGVHAVVGTSGLTDADVGELRAAFTASNCLVAPNFAIGAVLMIRLAELAAPFFETAEIIELHHDGKADAPSGTALHTAERLAAASAQWAPDPTRVEHVPGARGATGAGGIHVHSVRLRGIVAHQEILLGTTGQTLTIRHDSYDRTSFMPGVVLAAKRVADHPGVTVGLDAYLGL
jgi:4-hydroxy-tetrahydrodipicolinate reductase